MEFITITNNNITVNSFRTLNDYTKYLLKLDKQYEDIITLEQDDNKIIRACRKNGEWIIEKNLKVSSKTQFPNNITIYVTQEAAFGTISKDEFLKMLEVGAKFSKILEDEETYQAATYLIECLNHNYIQI